MNTPVPKDNQPPADRSPERVPTSPGLMPWILVAVPAGALVLGVLIGALVAGAGDENDATPEATATVTASTSVGPPDGNAIVIPRECLDAAESVQEATALLRDNVSAIQNFETDQILEVLNRLEDLTNEADERARQCSEAEITSTDPQPAATP
jgi:hypothetical protein